MTRRPGSLGNMSVTMPWPLPICRGTYDGGDRQSLGVHYTTVSRLVKVYEAAIQFIALRLLAPYNTPNANWNCKPVSS